MEGLIRRLKVNSLLFVGLIICLFAGVAFKDYTKETKYELPKLQSSQPEKIVEHSGYTVSFNTDWLIPNWVAYELTAEEVAGVERGEMILYQTRRFIKVRVRMSIRTPAMTVDTWHLLPT